MLQQTKNLKMITKKYCRGRSAVWTRTVLQSRSRAQRKQNKKSIEKYKEENTKKKEKENDGDDRCRIR